MVGPSQSVRGPWDDIICFLKGMTMGNGKVEKVDPVQNKLASSKMRKLKS